MNLPLRCVNRLSRNALVGVFFIALVLSHSASSAATTVSSRGTQGRSETSATRSINAEHRISNVRPELAQASQRLEKAFSLLPARYYVDEVVEGLKDFVKELASVVRLESLDMNTEERQIVANAHFESALLHLSSVLPIFTPSVAKTSLFYSSPHHTARDAQLWKDDWLVRLAMAVEEDSASASDFDNPKHYILHGVFPLNLPSALYHLNKASILGHAPARSLFPILSKIASRGHVPSTPLLITNNEKQYSSVHTSKTEAESLTKKAIHPVETGKAFDQSSSNAGSAHSPQRIGRVPRIAEWKMLEHLYQDMSAGARSPSALLAEGYQYLYGVDTLPQQCALSKKSLREATAPLLELLKSRIPSPPLEFDEHAAPPAKLAEQYSSQSMGSYKAPSEFEKIDLIDYYRYQAADPHQYQAKNTIGSIFLYGSYGFPRSYDTAYDYFSAANNIHPSSQLAYMHHMGIAKQGNNLNQAISLYSRAAAHNDSFALTQLGLMYLRGLPEVNIASEPKKALTYLHKAADRDEVEANFHLGVLYRHGHGHDIPMDPPRALQHIIVAATRGHLGALLELATLTGKCEDAVHLYLRVLHSVLLNPLAYRAYNFYTQGHYDHAAVLYNIMAALGHETGQLNAAWLHERGLVSSDLNLRDLSHLVPLNFPSLTPGSHEISVQLMKSSFENLNARLNELESNGYLDEYLHTAVERYEEGHSDDASVVAESTALGNREKASWDHQRHAFELYRLAAQQKSAEAQLKQGDFYFYGIGTEKDYNRSSQFYALASNGKHAQASYNLGYMYQRGLGVPKDPHLAKRYYDAAISASSDAYLPASIGLFSLFIQEFFQFNVDSTSSALDTFSHLSWDNTLLLFLTLTAICTAFMRWRLQ